MKWRARACLGLLLILALLGGWLLAKRGDAPIQTDLLALLPNTERDPLAEQAVRRLAQANGDRLVFVLEGHDDAATKAAALALGQRLRRDPVFSEVRDTLPPFDLSQWLKPYLAHRFSLLAAADRAALSDAGYEPAAALRARLNQPLLSGVGLGLQDDPFGWLQHWLDSQPWNESALLPEDDLLTAHRDQQSQVLLSAALAGSSYDESVQRRVLAAVAEAEQALRHEHPGVRLLRTGTLFDAAAARAGAQTDIHRVGLISTLGIALLLWWAFRGPRPLLLAFLSTAIGVLAASVISLLIFGQLHLLTLVFGAALLGEAVDYSIQYLCARAHAGLDWTPRRGLAQVAPALWLALATSVLGYALLGLAPFPALRQMACFAIVGLLAACLSVCWLLPTLLTQPAPPLAGSLVTAANLLQRAWSRWLTPRRGSVLALLLLALAIPGWCALGHDDDVHLLIQRPPELVAQEARIRELGGLGDGSEFYLVRGADVEQVLRREEALEDRLRQLQTQQRLAGFVGVAVMLPSQARQQADHALLMRRLGGPAQIGQRLRAAGFRDSAIADYLAAWPGRPLGLDDWLALPMSLPFKPLWMGCQAQGCASLVLPRGGATATLAAAAAGLPGIELVDKPASVSALFGRYRRYASVWLLAAAGLIAPLFGWRYGRAAIPALIAPPLLGIGVCLAVLGYLGQALTLFHWMALMLVLGVGANYAVFLREAEPYASTRPGAAYAGVWLSALTALLSFGLLAFSSMPALRHFGLTLALGIGATVLLAPLSLARETHSS